jgi:hypothetical protein
MNYSKHYDQLISRAKDRVLNEYYERHHIIPRCLGGSDEKSNFVKLTAREHFIAHLLLHKMHPNNGKLLCAVVMMCCGQEERKVSNRLYGWMRSKHSAVMSEMQSNSGNSQWGTKWICNVETLQNKKIAKLETVPEGWKLGRIIKPSKPVEPKINKLELQKDRSRQLAADLYNIYINGNYKSIREFCKSKHYSKSHVSLTILWRKYVPEYLDNVVQGKNFIPW